MNKKRRRRQWLQLGMHAFELLMTQKDSSDELVKDAYDATAGFYDTYWTQSMHCLSDELISRLNLKLGCLCLDLTCGTGYVTHQLYERTHGAVIGVDASEGMIQVARKNYGDTCTFIVDDAVAYLQALPSESIDTITCAWGIGYLSPEVFKEISRVLRKGGALGIIDNSLWSNWESIWFFIVALSEEPNALRYLLRPHFSPTKGALLRKMRWNGISVRASWAGKKIIQLHTKEEAMEQFLRSGAAAGVVQLVDEQSREEILTRAGELLGKYHASRDFVPIIHRYIAAVGEKK